MTNNNFKNCFVGIFHFTFGQLAYCLERAKEENLKESDWDNHIVSTQSSNGHLFHKVYFTISKWLTVSVLHILQNKRMRRCGVAPPPIIFERLNLPQQIIYRRKENLSESPNHQKYWENILVSRFYEQFSRNRRNLGHFRKFEKFQTLRTQT